MTAVLNITRHLFGSSLADSTASQVLYKAQAEINVLIAEAEATEAKESHMLQPEGNTTNTTNPTPNDI